MIQVQIGKTSFFLVGRLESLCYENQKKKKIESSLIQQKYILPPCGDPKVMSL